MGDFTVNFTNSTDSIFHMTCFDTKHNLTGCTTESHDVVLPLPKGDSSFTFSDNISYVKLSAIDLSNPMIAYYANPSDNNPSPSCIVPEQQYLGPYSFVQFFSEGTCNFAISLK